MNAVCSILFYDDRNRTEKCPKLYANAIQVDKSLKKMFEHQYIFSKEYDVQRLMSFHF